jgi:flagellar biosynthesis/type III secretory pathway chaperone
MNEPLQNLIEALREELKQYGEMLALLDHQQEMVMQRQTAGLLQSVAAVNTQAETLQAVRLEREQRRRHMARTLGLDEAIQFREMLPHLEANYRPLIQALVQENNELLVRIQQRARQNHLLLSRAVELMQEFIDSILPSSGTATYTEGGRVLPGALPQRALYNAVG